MDDVNKNLFLEHNAFIVHPVTTLTPNFDKSENVPTPDKCLNANVKAHTQFVLNSTTCNNIAVDNEPAEPLSDRCNIQI
nr:HycuOrf-4 hypothetical protein [Hyphantria cunea nucleopolyhedrovirus]UIX56277.1 HycuOrf-4 hypothetical protein [Hyphantria cunea nucleopolyhedrovirus]